MAAETTTTNPELLYEQVQTLLIEPLEAQSIMLGAGTRIFDSAVPLRIPKLVSSSDPAWVGEGEQIPEADVDFDEIKLMPTERKSLKTLIRFTNELARQSVIGLDSTLKARLVNDVARKLDTALLTGDGANDTVTGLINQPGVQKSTLDPSDPDTLLDALALAHAAEVQPTHWYISGADFFTLRKLKDGNGHYLVVPDLTQGAKYSLFGIPVTVTNKLEAGTAVLANMNEVAVVRDRNADVKILDQTFATTDEMAIRVVTRYDLGLLRPEGVIVLNSGE